MDNRLKLKAAFAKILKDAVAVAPELETWDMHYAYRHDEIAKALARVGISHKLGIVLDLGCGNSFSSALLSVIAKKVVATDLVEENPASHSTGLEKARKLQESLSTNAFIAAAVGEAIPFKEETFDAVFSMYVLEHVNDKRQVVSEIYRALKKNGLLILIVPNAAERIYAIPHYYLHAFKWLVKKIAAKPIKTTAGQHIARYGGFLFPPPHGNYKRSLDEFLAHRHKAWLGLLQQHFIIERVFAGMPYPIDFANELLGFRAGYRCFKSASRIFNVLERVFGERQMTVFGNSLCIIARKA